MDKFIIASYNLNDKEFVLLRDIVYKESGINLTDKKKALMQSRLIKRLRKLELDDYKAYYDYLMKHYNEELVNLINCITTNKTDFFRESKHFDFIKEKALPEFLKQGRDKIRIWSAGCSTGEEPYSIAMTVCEYFHDRVPDVKILATDIDTNVLDTGTKGIYRPEDFNDVDPNIIKKYFIKGKDGNEGLFIIRDFIKSMVSFRRLNLLDNVFPMKGQFDIIFCRNVIIYFDNPTRLKLFHKFYDCLDDNGYFFAGHSENLNLVSDKYYLIGNTIYQKKLS